MPSERAGVGTALQPTDDQLGYETADLDVTVSALGERAGEAVLWTPADPFAALAGAWIEAEKGAVVALEECR